MYPQPWKGGRGPDKAAGRQPTPLIQCDQRAVSVSWVEARVALGNLCKIVR